jgi:hypothetical protein
MPSAIGRFAADSEIIFTSDGPDRKLGLNICIAATDASKKI